MIIFWLVLLVINGALLIDHTIIEPSAVGAGLNIAGVVLSSAYILKEVSA